MNLIFDTHAHYDDEAFEEDREELLLSLPKQGVGKVVNVGASLASCKKTIELMQQYEFVYGALGVHPNEVGELDEESLAWLREQCRLEKCVAVGEIGLDYYYDQPKPSIQKQWFIRQLDLARELSLPVVIHSREAAKDTIDIMKQQHAEEIGGVVHCFSYTKETAKIMLDMGFYIGIGGVLTFKNGVKLKEAAAFIPIDRIVPRGTFFLSLCFFECTSPSGGAGAKPSGGGASGGLPPKSSGGLSPKSSGDPSPKSSGSPPQAMTASSTVITPGRIPSVMRQAMVV